MAIQPTELWSLNEMGHLNTTGVRVSCQPVAAPLVWKKAIES